MKPTLRLMVRLMLRKKQAKNCERVLNIGKALINAMEIDNWEMRDITWLKVIVPKNQVKYNIKKHLVPACIKFNAILDKSLSTDLIRDWLKLLCLSNVKPELINFRLPQASVAKYNLTSVFFCHTVKINADPNKSWSLYL